MIGSIEEFRRQFERDHLPFEYQAMTAEAYSMEGLQKLQDIGVDEVIIAFRNPYDGTPDTQTLDEKIAMINWYAENVMQPYRAQA